MPADADASLGMQAALALSFATRVLKQLRLPARATVAKDDIRDELFEARVLFHRRSRPIARVRRVEQALQVAIRLAAEALEMSQLMKDGCGDYQHMFGRDLRHPTIPCARGSSVIQRVPQYNGLPRRAKQTATFRGH